jgi:hypothetical protein
MTYGFGIAVMPVHKHFFHFGKIFRSEQGTEIGVERIFTGLNHNISGSNGQIEVLLGQCLIVLVILLPCTFKKHKTRNKTCSYIFVQVVGPVVYTHFLQYVYKVFVNTIHGYRPVLTVFVQFFEFGIGYHPVIIGNVTEYAYKTAVFIASEEAGYG